MAMNAQDLIKELQKTVDELQVFNELGKTLTSTLEISEVLKTIMQKVSELLGPTAWSLFLLEPDEKNLAAEIMVGEQGPYAKRKRVAVGFGLIGWCAQNRKAILIPDPTSKKLYTPELEVLASEAHRSCLVVPLISKNRLLGVIKLVNDGKDDQIFRQNDLAILSTFGDYAAIAIENARNFMRIQELTITDDLTGLFNSRHLHVLLEGEVDRAQRYNKHFSLIFLDLDRFKKVNDQHNHLRGSQLLREVAEVIRGQLRTVDIPTRYGGDEFVLMLPETNKEQAIKVAQRIREAINAHTFLSSASLEIKITASFGVASFPEHAKSKEDLIRLADEAMYKVKNSTRDSIAAA